MAREATAQAAARPATDDQLRARRMAASAHSRGTSSDAIYEALERVLAERGAGGDLIDFGAGTGALALRLLATGRLRSITGADLLTRPDVLDEQVTWVQADLNDAVPLPACSFDVVVAAEVIEHLENPRAVARELYRLLRPGGLALLSTPNNESWRAVIALVVRGHFVSFGDSSYPAHITPLVRLDLKRILIEAGFVAPAFAFTDLGGIPGLPSRTWQSLFGRRARGLRFSDNVLVTARRPAAGE